MRGGNVVSCAGLLMALTGVAGAQSITNAGFENYMTGSPTNFTGWTEFVTGGRNCNGSNSGPKRGSGYTGSTSVALSGNSPCVSGFYQTISGLTSGQTYNISFYAKVNQGNPENGLSVFFGGNQVFGQQIENSVWQLFTTTTVANGTSAQLKFEGFNKPGSTFIDNVNLMAVTTTPEPGTLALLGTGLVGLLPVVRRRKK